MTRALVLAAVLGLGTIVTARAQQAAAPPDDFLTSMGWATTVPEAKDFVQRTRRAPETLEFRTPYASDAPRPRPRNAAEVDELARDLERASARNRARAVTAVPTSSALPSAVPARSR